MKLRAHAPLLTSMVYVQALLLIRSVLIARYLGPEQFGLVLTFVLIQQFLDTASDVGINKYILSAPAGHQKRPQAVLHSIAVSRSIIIAVLLVAVAYPVFHSFDDRLDLTAFGILAVSTFVNGLVHTDSIREQRVQIFRTQALSNAMGETAALVFAAVYLTLHIDYTVALLAILVRSIVATLSTHLLARRAYKLRYERAIAKPIWVYALPLIINGPLLFLSAQADRLIVSATLGPKELGIYSAALLLIMSPASIFARFLGSVYLPKLSRERNCGSNGTFRQFTVIMLAASALIAIGFASLGQYAVHLLFGKAFAIGLVVTALIGALQAVRFLRNWPITISLANGRTDNVLKSNIIRLITLPFAWLSYQEFPTLAGLLLGLIAGETIALVATIMLVKRAR